MSTCTIGRRPFFITIFFLLFASSLLAGNGTDREEPIPLFSATSSSGEVSNSTELFSGRHVVLVVTGKSCSRLGPFLTWQKQLSPDKTQQTLIFCVRETSLNTTGLGGATPPLPIWFAKDDATTALGITGTPMLLAIEENSVKWRIAGFINQWQSLASNWLERFDKGQK